MKVAIIGTGISGLTLALRLQQLGVETTVFTDRSSDEVRRGQVECLVARFPATQARERELGVAHWDGVDGFATEVARVDVVGTPLGFDARVAGPVQGVDFRVYLPQLADDYVSRGGHLVVGPLPATASDLVGLTAGHDVVVVAAGRAAPVGRTLFPVRRDRSPYVEPQRRLLGGLFTGVRHTDPITFNFTIVPGAGEVFRQTFLTDRGIVTAMLVEAIPGGPLEPVAALDPVADPGGFADAIAAFAPRIASSIDRDRFAALGERDVIRGAITPTVREGWAELDDGRVAIAIGDAWIVNDPITGQGANTGSHCAWTLASALATCDAADRDFAASVSEELWCYAGAVTGWTNAFLQPPPPHVLDLLGAATEHAAVADAFIAGFADPARFAAALATPDGTRALVDSALTPVHA
jgi:2-polyprenyl-6-methoxyphenol hydroxylase-like FAD-dependent oxidoreductase